MRFITKNHFDKGSQLFLQSIFFGIFTWFFIYILTPVKAQSTLSFETTSFIVLNYIALIFGFVITYFSNFNYKNLNKIASFKNLLTILVILVSFSSLVRLFDLFFVRKISIFNDIASNKVILSDKNNFSVFFGLISVFRLLYFVPLMIYLERKHKNFKTIFFYCLFFLLPILEGYLRGSRRLIFESIALIILIFQLNGSVKLLTKKTALIVVVSVCFLVGLSSHLLKKRDKVKDDNSFFERIYSAPYNKFIPIKDDTQKFINDNKDNPIGSFTFGLVHFGQYYIHGVYEFDYLKNQDFNKKNGLYNGFIIVKLLNKLNLTDYPLDNLMNPTKRITFITFFGGLYLDFGWFSLVLMLFLGILQSYFFKKYLKYPFLRPVIVVFMFSNFFLLTFNFIRAQMLIVLIVYMAFLFFVSLFKTLSKN